ncbi:MAG: DUF29 domain-containing protein, partial [Alphaproteobacteria bacterium]
LRTASEKSIDGPHLAEEIEDLGKSDRRALASHLQNLILHLLKWQYQSEKRNASWVASIRKSRKAAQKLLSESPSLVPALDVLITEEYPDARDAAIVETGLRGQNFPISCPYSTVQLGDPGYPLDLPEAK